MKRAATFLILLVCLALGGLHWVDLLNFSDMATGFALEGEAWMRYAALGGALVLFALASFLAAKKPVCMLHRSPLMGGCAFVCGLAWAAAGGFKLAGALRAADRFGMVLSGLFVLTALWFLLVAVSRLTRQAQAPSGSAWMGVLGTLSFYVLAVLRFSVRPSSVDRVPVVIEVVSAVAALLFMSVVVRSVYLPFTPCGRRLSFFGFAAFLFCTCLELPQSFCLWVAGSRELSELLLSLVLGFTGLMGGLAALSATEETVPPEILPEGEEEAAGEA